MPNAEYLAYIGSPAWQAKRLVALEAADHRCQVCNARSRLDVHHRTYERFGDEDPLDLTVLCRSCHELFHRAKRSTQKPKIRKRPRASIEEVYEALCELAPASVAQLVDHLRTPDCTASSPIVGNALGELRRAGRVWKYGNVWTIGDAPLTSVGEGQKRAEVDRGLHPRMQGRRRQ